MKNEIVECKLPKGKKWSDEEVIKETSPYCAKYHGQLYCPNGKYCYFYPIGEELYVKGMFGKVDKNKQKIVDIVVKLTDYKNLTGVEAWSTLSEQVFSESMILNVWNKLGLRLGFMVPILRDLNWGDSVTGKEVAEKIIENLKNDNDIAMKKLEESANNGDLSAANYWLGKSVAIANTMKDIGWLIILEDMY